MCNSKGVDLDMGKMKLIPNPQVLLLQDAAGGNLGCNGEATATEK
jgi:hypothetical protein